MTNYRRDRTGGGTWFFTVNLLNRKSDLLIRHADLLRETVMHIKKQHPFRIEAMVVLPEHTHCIWTLPDNDHDYAKRWRLIKSRFSRSLPAQDNEIISRSRMDKGERGVWQRRYWEHRIRDDEDFRKHMDYIHYNPVKHGWVKFVEEWQYSSFHRLVREGYYPPDWGGDAAVRQMMIAE